MPAPTPDRLFRYLDEELIAPLATEGRHPLFEWEYLVTETFRRFRTTSPAARSRLETLRNEGRLVPVEVNHSGHVFFDQDEFRGSLMYFQYTEPYNYRGENVGYVTYKRPKEHGNVWRDGMRHLYTTTARFDEMLTDMLDSKRAADAAKQAEERAEAEETEKALRKVVSDGPELLQRLKDAVPSADANVMIWGEGKRGRVRMEAGGRDFQALFDILRRGLPDVPRETSRGDQP